MTVATIGKPLSTDDLHAILNGACILGCGGGGPLSLGSSLLTQIIQQGTVYLADPINDLPDDALTAIAAGVGSPLAASEGFPFDVASIAFKSLDDRQAAASGKHFSFVLPAEVGAGNSIVPMTVAVKLGLPIIDADGARRAIPELDMVTYASHNLPISPIVLANATQAITFYAPNPAVAGVTADGIISGGAFTEDAGISLWSMTGADVKAAAIPHTMSYARDLGIALKQTLAEQKDPVEAVRAYLDGTVIFKGTIDSTSQTTEGGFDFGTLVLKNERGRLTIYNQNENLIAWSSLSPKPLALAPDLICYLTTDGQPFTNADLDLAQGKEIAVIAASCLPQMRVPAILDKFLKALKSLGYAGSYVPVEELLKGSVQ
ncbi:hypothetical protein ACPOL_5565 [Acidisarcina polymorpha]|uniref:N-methylhydantoinase (ATP-hydrolyzing) n=1 Tax=Acidisarcina polymorpha TaxID=2211140 RepID=A0A2Z5G6C8_9BACT|nr:DUF917 domain-containing protein [Acidisarcina polymorpha]AXC14813.1 hypothetical protein ACPOL_5565 [Acidisarcina polymorpha]